VTIASVSILITAYSAQPGAAGNAGNAPARATPTAAAPATAPVASSNASSAAPQESYVVTLGGNAPHPSKIIDVTATIEKTPLTVAWAPQLFSQAGSNGNNQLSLDEFASQLRRVGVDTASAKKLFDAFDTSQSGALLGDDFVEGIKRAFGSDSDLFTRLIDTYTKGPDGHDDVAATNKFLSDGLAQANRYWAGKR
jgi:hypothetical protein